jgi:eukaryotic-like serine/threonine-protein kinase
MKCLYEFGPFRVDAERCVLLREDEPVPLTPKVFETLLVLIQNREQTVSKDLLLKTVWPDTFVEEANLTQHISMLRKALGETPQDRRYIVTVPGRGYRFVAHVQEVTNGNGNEDAIVVESHTRSHIVVEEERPDRTAGQFAVLLSLVRGRTGVAVAISVLVAIGIGLWLARRSSRHLTEKDSVLLADFDNSTGESVFDGALKQAMAVGLGQSPFLDVVADDQVREALRFMGRSSEERVTPRLAREVCERLQSKALISGSIVRLGTKYVLGVQTQACADATVLAREQTSVDNKEQVLPAIGGMVSKLRQELGESLSSIQHFDVPIEQATTPSLEALRAYSLAIQQRAQGTERQAIPVFEHAIELDPGFAMAYAQLGGTYSNLGETERGASYLKTAFAMRSKLSEREKFYLTTRYHTLVTGDIDKATSTYEMWTHLYPRDWMPLNGLSARYQVIGEYDKAAEAATRSLQIHPNHYVAYANLAMSDLALGRFEEARRVCEQAAAHRRDSLYTHRVLFELAFLKQDRAAMQQEIDWAHGTERENDMLTNQALAEIASGRLRSARQLFERSWGSSKSAGLQDNAAFSMGGEALAEADFGNYTEAETIASSAVQLGRGIDGRETATEALALSNKVDRARALANELHERFPQHTVLNAVSLPTIFATIELQRGNPAKAVQILQAAVPYDLCEFSSLAAIYIRGQAYLKMRSGKEAAAEFRKILDHPGVAATSQRHPLAYLGLARALAMDGNFSDSRKAYERFFSLWSNADTDVPVLNAAKLEYKRLD